MRVPGERVAAVGRTSGPCNARAVQPTSAPLLSMFVIPAVYYLIRKKRGARVSKLRLPRRGHATG